MEYTPATEEEDALFAYQCSGCGNISQWKRVPNSAYYLFNVNSADKIRKAPQNGTVTITTDKWISFIGKVLLPALQSRPDVTVVVNYTYNGKPYQLVIPAGTDLSAKFNADGYCGFLNL